VSRSKELRNHSDHDVGSEGRTDGLTGVLQDIDMESHYIAERQLGRRSDENVTMQLERKNDARVSVTDGGVNPVNQPRGNLGAVCRTQSHVRRVAYHSVDCMQNIVTYGSPCSQQTLLLVL